MNESELKRRVLPPPNADHFRADYSQLGDQELTIEIGGLQIRMFGLSPELSMAMRERYDRFVAEEFNGGLSVELCAAGRDYYIDPPEQSEFNPVHLICDGDVVRFISYTLAGIFETTGTRGRLLVADGDIEPADRAIENFVRTAIAWRAAEIGGALVHAASAVWDGRGYLFYGESGAGKSTLSACNRRATIISDDLSLVIPGDDGQPLLAGTPFRGTYEEGERVVGRFPLVAGFRLVQAAESRVEEVPRIRALSELIGNLPFVAEGFVKRPDLFDKVQRGFAQLPLRHLHFSNRDDGYWDAIRDAGL
jgi:hypothetical protein